MGGSSIKKEEVIAFAAISAEEDPPHPERSGHSVKIKLDGNLPLRLVPILSRLGHETDTIPQEGFAGQDDADVWEAV